MNRSSFGIANRLYKSSSCPCCINHRPEWQLVIRAAWNQNDHFRIVLLTHQNPGGLHSCCHLHENHYIKQGRRGGWGYERANSNQTWSDEVDSIHCSKSCIFPALSCMHQMSFSLGGLWLL